MNLQDLRETAEGLRLQMLSANNDGRAIIGRAESAGRGLSASEQSACDRHMTKFETLEREFKAVQREINDIEADEREAVLSTPQPRRAQPNAIANGRTPSERVPSRGGSVSNFANLFGGVQPADPYNGQFQTFGAFALAVAGGGQDPRLIRNSSTTSTGGEGASAGYLVPMQWVQSIMDAAFLLEVVRPRANVVPIVVGQASVVGFDSTDGTGSKRAGLFLDWGVGEGEDLYPQKPKAREVNYSAAKASIFCRVSTELAEDAPNFDRQLNTAMIAAVAAGLDTAFIAGTGAGQPLGIINAPNLITISKESGQAASTLFLQNLAKMVGRLTASSFARSVWLVHPTAVPQLYLMSYTVKNVAGAENVGGTAAQAITVDANGQLRIFGLPCIVTDACAPLSSKGDVMLADLSRYTIAMRSDVRLKRDESRYFDTDEIAFKLTMRLDGAPDDATATKLRDGTNTVSPFVTLEAR